MLGFQIQNPTDRARQEAAGTMFAEHAPSFLRKLGHVRRSCGKTFTAQSTAELHNYNLLGHVEQTS